MEARINEMAATVRVPWTVVASGLWLRLAIAAAGVSALGIALLLDGGTSAATALALVVAGIAGAAFGVVRAMRALDDAPAKAAPVAPAWS